MKKILCDRCHIEYVEADKNFEHKFCCNGMDCCCFGNPINSIFCKKCIEDIDREYEEWTNREREKIKK